MSNELNIKIKKDSKGSSLSLENITIEAAESLKIFIDSLVKFANLYDNSSQFKISLKDGSVESCLSFPTQSETIIEDINNIFEGKSTDKKKIKALKNIQDKIKLNGLDYEVSWKINNEVKDITQVFKGKNFSYKRSHSDSDSEIVFLQGRLFEAGGKKITNIHIEYFDKEYKVDCTEQEAIVINRLLYKNVYLSARKRTKSQEVVTYQLVDYYENISEYTKLSEFYQKIVSNHKLEKFDLLHEKIYQLIMEDRLNEVKKIVKIFDNEFTERGIIRTILMSLKPVIKKDDFLEIRPFYESLSDTLRAKSLNRII